MKYGLNKVTLVGNVGDTPRFHENGNSKGMVTFSIATNDYYKDSEGKEVKTTEWHRIIAFNKRAEVIRDYVKKGDPLFVEGRLRLSSYEDKDGVKKESTDIICDNFLFLSTRNG